MVNPSAYTKDLRQKLTEARTLDNALSELRTSGASVLQCVIAVNACRGCGLNEAKKLVYSSPAWADVKERQEKLLREEGEAARNTPVLVKMIRYLIVFGLFGVCIGILVRGEYLSTYYYLHSQQHPDPSQGAVFPLIIHHGGYKDSHPVRVYVTEKEWHDFSPTSDDIFAGIFCVALVGGGILGFRWKLL